MSNKQYRYPIVFFTLVLICCSLHWFLSDETKMSLLTTPVHLTQDISFLNLSKAALAGFLHVNFNHLFGNCLLLVLLGFALEKQIGHKKSLLLLLCAGVGALLIHVFSNPWSPIPFLGASGYVFGVLTVYCLRL